MSNGKLSRLLLPVLYLFTSLIFPLFVMSVASQRLANIPLRLLFFAVLVLGGAWLIFRAWSQKSWGIALSLTALVYGFVYKLASFLPEISTYPFSLSWSEGSRFYYASLWFAKQLYGFSEPLSVLHPSRYLMQSLPFLFQQAPLLVHRIWQVLLWIGTACLTSWLLTRRLNIRKEKQPVIVSLCVFSWAFLFLFQGPVYYHLLVMVIVLLWGFDGRHFWRNLLLVIVASMWAGISRVNWLPVPGMLAAAIYLLECPARGKGFWRYVLPPTIWVLVGTGVAYATQHAYITLSGNPTSWFGSSFSSDLLWYRLLPNPTYPLGILPSAILVSLPLVGLIVLRLYQHWRGYHFIRLFSLAGILFVLFAGGVIVSVKIGGGSNLHNLDAYLALLLVIGSYIGLGQFESDTHIEGAMIPEAPKASNILSLNLERLLIAGVVLIPLYFTLSVGGQLPRYDFSAAQSALQKIDSAAQEATKTGRQVLFISQRHLLTFNLVHPVPLVPEYELVFLMEMAMANNPAYLDAFNADLQQQRFALIVVEPLTTQHQGRSHSFGEENDAWVERVSEPILCYYEPTTTLDAVGVNLYTPKSAPCK